MEFFQRVNPDSNDLIHDFTDPAHDTRFLGDLYQNLSEYAQERYALCQTPAFIINFILDRTLSPALDTFGVETVRMIDPACGSGHFLLAAFSRLLRLWQSKQPGTNTPALVQRVLHAVYGVDLNPFAIEISRFRLLVASLEATGMTRLKDAPNFIFNLATGDSLLHGSRVGGGGVERDIFEDRLQHFYDSEDAEELKRILGQLYHVVVGNPPYINVNDQMLRDAYRSRFATCRGKYQLGVPFTERFFDLTFHSVDHQGETAGWMGMIVSNAFMRSVFGKTLVEEYLSRKDLTHVIDTSGMNLPGYGTPTVILLARHRPPIISKPIRAVRGIIGMSTRGDDLASSLLWREIVEGVDRPGFSGNHITVTDVPRSNFSKHPWTTGGGGAAELKTRLDLAGNTTLESLGDTGVQTLTLADDIFVRPLNSLIRLGIVETMPFSTGDDIRDWTAQTKDHIYCPGDIPPKSLWIFRTTLSNRKSFLKTQIERGLRWWDYGMVVRSRLDPPLIALGYIVTHNHFALCGARQAFDQHALVIRPLNSGAQSLLHLLGLLNSSVACFWLRQVCHDKGGGGVGGGLASEPWERFMCVDSSKLKQFPVPIESPIELTRLILSKIHARSVLLPDQICAGGDRTRERLNIAESAGRPA